MKSFVSVVFLCVLFSFGRCQDGEKLKLDQLGEMLTIVRSLESTIEEMVQKQDLLVNEVLLIKEKLNQQEDHMTAIHVSLSEEMEQKVSQKQDLLVNEVLLIKEKLNRHEEMRDKACTSDQMTAIQVSLSEGVDDCNEGLHQCGPFSQCINLDGNYTCTCQNGYTGDGFTCEDIDECATSEDACHRHAFCLNTDGGFNCTCRSGFSGDGHTCQVIGCESPSVMIDDIGCVIPVKTTMNWESAQANCKTLGGRLLEGITSQSQLDQLKKIFHNPMNGVYVGFRKLSWVEGGDAIDPQSPLWEPSYPIHISNECGTLCMDCRRPSFFNLECTVKWYSVCEMI